MFDLRAILKKKKVILTLCVAFVGLASTTAILSNSLNNQSKLVAEATQYPFKLTISIEKNTYKLYEPINMTVTLKNVGEKNVTITFLSRPNPSPYWFWRVYDENDQLVFYHKAAVSVPSLEEMTLQPAQSMQQNCTWDQKATNSEQQVSSGIYYLTAHVSFLYNEEEVLLETRIEICIRE